MYCSHGRRSKARQGRWLRLELGTDMFLLGVIVDGKALCREWCVEDVVLKGDDDDFCSVLVNTQVEQAHWQECDWGGRCWKRRLRLRASVRRRSGLTGANRERGPEGAPGSLKHGRGLKVEGVQEA